MAAVSPWGTVSRPVLNCLVTSSRAFSGAKGSSPERSQAQFNRSFKNSRSSGFSKAAGERTASVGWKRPSSFFRWPRPSSPAGREVAYTSPVEMSHRQRPKPSSWARMEQM